MGKPNVKQKKHRGYFEKLKIEPNKPKLHRWRDSEFPSNINIHKIFLVELSPYNIDNLLDAGILLVKMRVKVGKSWHQK